MRTKLQNILTVLLLCLANLTVFGQSSTKAEFTVDVKPTGNGWEVTSQKFEVVVIPAYERSGAKYTPKGSTVNVIPVSENKQNLVKQIRYNGQTINVPPDYKNTINANASFFSGSIRSMTITVSINGSSYTKELEIYGNRKFDISINVPAGEKPNFAIGGFQVLDVKFDDKKVKAVVDGINVFNSAKDEKAKKELDDKIAEGKKERETSNDRTQNTNNSYRYNNVSATQQKIATIDNAHSEFNKAIDQVSESLRKESREHQQKSADYWDKTLAAGKAEEEKWKAAREQITREKRDRERKADETANRRDGIMSETLAQRKSGEYDFIGNFSKEGLARVLITAYDNQTNMNFSKFGFVDKTGKEIIPLKYDGAEDFSEGLALVYIGYGLDNIKIGFIDKSGKEVIPLQYNWAYSFSEGLAPVKLNRKWGFIDKTRKEVIPFKYDDAYPFSEGLAYVGNDEGNYGFIDKTGKVVIPFKYSYIKDNSFSEGMAVVRLYSYSVRTDKHTEKYGFVDKTGQEVVPLEYDFAEPFKGGKAKVKLDGKEFYIDKKEIEEKQQEKIRSQIAQGIAPDQYDEMGKFSKEGLAYVSVSGKFGFIDKNGKEIIPPKYDAVSPFSEYLDGLSVVMLNEKIGSIDPTGKEVIPLKYESFHSSNGLAIMKFNNKMGIIDKTGKEITPFKYEGIGEFSDGLAPVVLNGKYGFIDKTGKEAIPLKFDGIGHEGFSEGLSQIALSNKWGYIDKSGKEVIPVRYEFAGSFSEGMAAVKMDGKWGFIDNTGKVIIEIRYDMANSFSEGLALVNMGGTWEFDESSYDFQPAQDQLGKYGFVNNAGTEIIQLKYDFAWAFNDGLAMVVSNQKWGFIGKSGEEVVPLKYDRVETFQDGLAMVMLDNKVGFVDQTGKEVIPLIYDGAEPFYNGSGKTTVKLNDRVFYIDKSGKEVRE
ncbi:WG repeat-containing protein [Echinicola marina]|uniref:WG repeat-containing protein n=1 Tax=Echinicola marina TaxID=2859768 RepID=UPI001CF6A4E1|nr:WG repeat-containing protein [Echinicola marina]UCS92171.1 WG repeat-containing protein [Echinicola marina]